MNNHYLYQGKIYNCSEVTTEAELYGAECFYGYGKTLLFLDELEGGNYVNADDCVQVAPQLSCGNCQHYSSEPLSDDYKAEEWCTLLKWEFEEPVPSPVTTCELFEFAVAEIEYPVDLNFEEF